MGKILICLYCFVSGSELSDANDYEKHIIPEESILEKFNFI